MSERLIEAAFLAIVPMQIFIGWVCYWEGKRQEKYKNRTNAKSLADAAARCEREAKDASTLDHYYLKGVAEAYRRAAKFMGGPTK